MHKFRKRIENGLECNKTKLLSENAVPLAKRHFLNSFTMSKEFKVTDETTQHKTSESPTESDHIVDALINQVSKLHNIPSFILLENGSFLMNFKDSPIQITKDIYLKLDNISYVGGKVSSIEISLLSNTISATEITTYIMSIYKTYLETIKNSLGNNIYFFDHKDKSQISTPQITANMDPDQVHQFKQLKISSAPKELSFTMTLFQSNKSFENIFGKEIRAIEQRVKFFIENKEWYDKKGIPYQLGLLLSGLPGSGKTSVIRAIANYTKRHIININFANISTATQLKNLFFSEKLQVYKDNTLSSTQFFFIPIDQRLYVLEEIDAIGDIVKQRTKKNKAGSETINDELTLMEILTVLDGTMESPGRIVIMTSNHPEYLDKALVRPGRIDVKVSFTYANRDQISDMYESYFDKKISKEGLERIPEGTLSPAEVGQVFFRHFGANRHDDENVIIEDMIKTSSEKSHQGEKQEDTKEEQNICKPEIKKEKLMGHDEFQFDTTNSGVGAESVPPASCDMFSTAGEAFALAAGPPAASCDMVSSSTVAAPPHQGTNYFTENIYGSSFSPLGPTCKKMI